MPVSVELQPVLDLLRARAQARQGQPLSWEERRQSYDDLGAAFADLDGVAVGDPIDAGGVRAVWVDAEPAHAQRAVLFLHGGGYVLGSPVSHSGVAAGLSRTCRARVLLLDYRRAPEHPFPAPVEDAVAAYRWLLDGGTDPAQIFIAGDSAGGGLTVAALVAMREAGLPLPAGGACLSPWVDMEALGESMDGNAAQDPMISREGILAFADAYLNGGDPRAPHAAPLYADLGGLPPLLIQVGSAETLLDDATRLADRAKQAGVDTTLEVWDAMPHVWHMFAPKLPEGSEALERIGEFAAARFRAG